MVDMIHFLESQTEEEKKKKGKKKSFSLMASNPFFKYIVY